MKFACALISLTFLYVQINCQQLQYTPEQRRELIQLSNQCIAETGVLPQYVDQARLGNYIENNRLKSFAFCMSKKLGFQDAFGNLNTEAIRARVLPVLTDPQLADNIIQRCAIQRVTPEDTAYEAAKCAFENSGIRLI